MNYWTQSQDHKNKKLWPLVKRDHFQMDTQKWIMVKEDHFETGSLQDATQNNWNILTWQQLTMG